MGRENIDGWMGGGGGILSRKPCPCHTKTKTSSPPLKISPLENKLALKFRIAGFVH
jgi:hypothetical protein